MAVLIENYIPVVRYEGLNTDKAVTFGSTVAVTGAASITGAVTLASTLTVTGQSTIVNPVLKQTITNVDAQSATPTIAQILGGIIVHTSVTGAGTATVPTGTAMSAGVTGVAVGTTIKWTYINDGNQTVTITAATGHTLVGGTAAVTTGKWMQVTSINTAANTWISYLQTLM